MFKVFMQSNFAQQWSTALGINVSAVAADQAGVERLSQSMVDFMQMRGANTVMEKINLELNSLEHFGESLRLKVDYGNGIVVNDDTKELADSFLLEATQGVQGKWPAAWGDDLKEPLMLFVAYTTASNALTKGDNINWSKTLPLLAMTYAKEKGPEKLREQINSIDQFLPQVLIGAAQGLLDVSTMSDFSKKMQDFTEEHKGGPRLEPVAFLDVLLEVRNKHLSLAAPTQLNL